MRRLMSVLGIVALLCVCCAVVFGEELKNDSRITAVAVRITFSSRVRITDYGREFSGVEPSSGMSDVFVFTGGNLRRNQTFEIEWAPSFITVESVEWLSEYTDDSSDQPEQSCTNLLRATWGSIYDLLLERQYDGMVICLEPGRYEVLASTVRVDHDIVILGTGANSAETIIAGGGFSGSNFMVWGSATLRFENLTLADGVALQTLERATCEVANAQIDSAFAGDESTMSISGCQIGGDLYVNGSATLLVESCQFVGDGRYAVSLHESASATISNTVFANREFGISVRDNVNLTVLSCRFEDSLLYNSISIASFGFAGSIGGRENMLAGAPIDESLEWPEGFFSE